MDREIKTIKVGKYEVDIVTYITWGESQEIENSIISGVDIGNDGLKGFNANALANSKYKALEICIKKITEAGKEIKYSKEWIDNLRVDEGDLLYKTINEVTEPDKKKS